MLYAQTGGRIQVVDCLGEHHAERTHIHALSRRIALIDEVHHLRHKKRIVETLGLVVDVGANRLHADFILYAVVHVEQRLSAFDIHIFACVLTENLYLVVHSRFAF